MIKVENSVFKEQLEIIIRQCELEFLNQKIASVEYVTDVFAVVECDVCSSAVYIPWYWTGENFNRCASNYPSLEIAILAAVAAGNGSEMVAPWVGKMMDL